MNNFEINMFQSLTKYFSNNEILYKLAVIAEYSGGFEEWFQIETMFALFDAEILAGIKGQQTIVADIVVRNRGEEIGIEIRCWKIGLKRDDMINALVEHPRADLHLFLFRDNNDKFMEFEDNLSRREFIQERLDSDRVLMLVK